jgi:hypothetical protein
VLACVPGEEEPQGFHFYFYLVFMIISTIFLLLTLVAFSIAPEMQNLHGKCIACQSGSLMIAFVALIVNYLGGSHNSVATCIVFGKTNLQLVSYGKNICITKYVFVDKPVELTACSIHYEELIF